jgi:predicted amidophosphoribosyltransferase
MSCALCKNNLAWINKSAQSLVVIDNVVTTGGTASAAVKALVEAGVKEEKIVVLALCQAKLKFK